MKKTIVIFALSAFAFTACNNSDRTTDDVNYPENSTVPEYQAEPTPGQRLDTTIEDSKEALEDAKRKGQETGREIKADAKEFGQNVKEGAQDVKNDVKDAAHDAKVKAQKDKEVLDRKTREAKEEMKNN